MLEWCEENEYVPDISVQVAVAERTQQTGSLARGMDSDIALYVSRSGHPFICYQQLNQTSGFAGIEQVVEGVWPILNEEAWQIFLAEDFGQYTWTVFDEAEFAPLQRLAEAAGVHVSFVIGASEPVLGIEPPGLPEGRVCRPTLVLAVDHAREPASMGSILRDSGDVATVMVVPTTTQTRREIDAVAEEAGMTSEDFLRWCVERGMRLARGQKK